MPEIAAPWSTVADQSGPAEMIHEREFDLLDRVIELVAQSGTFSKPALAAALQLTDRKAARLTTELELLGVISRGDEDSAREVFIHPYQLATFLSNFRARRQSQSTAA